MNLYKGDKTTLYCEFKKDDKIVNVKEPKVRVLHEYNDKVYEDLPWQKMKKMDNGYCYVFDTNVCKNYGKYVVVFSGKYKCETLNVLDDFHIIAKNIDDNNTIYVYGYINDINSNRILKSVQIQIVSLDSGDIIYQTSTDEDGKWESNIFPGDYEFKFSMDNYESRSVRAQVGDENKEIQFNNVSLEHIADVSLGNGLYKIEDEFITKNDMGIENVSVLIYNVDDTENVLVSTKTNNKGKWKAFLDSGTYIVKIELPSGTKKTFQMIVYNDGTKAISEIQTKDTSIDKNSKKVLHGKGTENVTDFILDAHGNGIEGAVIKAYKYKPCKDDYEYECEDVTNKDGQFVLNLNKGKYKFVIEHPSFTTNEQIVEI